MPAGKHIKKQGIHTTTYLTLRRKNPSEAKIQECSTDSCQLHKLKINNLTKPQEEQQWPKHNNPESLANEFADYFETKIFNIRKTLEDTPPYQSMQHTVPIMSRLAPMTENEVGKVINSL